MRKIFGLMLLLLAPLAVAAECDSWKTGHPDWIWCDDFESSSSLTSRYEDVSLNGMSVTGGSGLDGSQSLTQQYSLGQANAGWIIKVLPAGYPDHVFYRYYQKFGAGFSQFQPKMSRIGFRDRSTWTEIFRVHSWLKSDGTLTADVLAKNSTQANSSGWLPVAISDFSFANHSDEWVAIEVEVKLNTPGQQDGLYRTWVNDQLVIERLNVDLRGNTTDKINEIMLDTYWNGGATGNLSRYYDNFVMSTQKIGLVAQSKLAPPMPPSNVSVNP